MNNQQYYYIITNNIYNITTNGKLVCTSITINNLIHSVKLNYSRILCTVRFTIINFLLFIMNLSYFIHDKL